MAGLGINYVRAIERGHRTPGWEILKRLATALELTPDELDALVRAVDFAAKPKDILATTTTPPIPGLVLLKHLPSLLYAIPHREVISLYVDPDQVLRDLAWAAGSLLAWVALKESPMTEREVRALRSLKERARQEACVVVPRMTIGNTGEVASEAGVWAMLPRCWRELLFTERRTAETHTKLLQEWEYHPRPFLQGREALSVRFKDRNLHTKYGFSGIEPEEVTNLHDGMVFAQLLCELDWNGPYHLFLVERTRVKTAIGAMASADLARCKAELTPSHALGENPLPKLIAALGEHGARVRYVRFALRIGQCPLAAGITFGADWESILSSAASKCTALESMLIDARTVGQQIADERNEAIESEIEGMEQWFRGLPPEQSGLAANDERRTDVPQSGDRMIAGKGSHAAGPDPPAS